MRSVHAPVSQRVPQVPSASLSVLYYRKPKRSGDATLQDGRVASTLFILLIYSQDELWLPDRYSVHYATHQLASSTTTQRDARDDATLTNHKTDKEHRAFLSALQCFPLLRGC